MASHIVVIQCDSFLYEGIITVKDTFYKEKNSNLYFIISVL